jgi:hypothetical protein
MLTIKKDLKMRIFTRLLSLVLVTVASAGAGLAATVNVSCDFLSISNACMTAKEGDLLWIQPGDCVISNGIMLNRNISFTIAGSGTNQTTLRSAPGLNSVFKLYNGSANTFTIRDLNCVGDRANGGGFFEVGNLNYAWNGRFHIYNITMTNLQFRGFSVGAGKINVTPGLIDHWSIIAPTNSYNPQFFSFQGADYASWTNTANPIGTSNAVYVEDCYCYNTPNNYGNGFFDAYDGAQFVIRHCYFDGYSAAGCHGYDSQPTSARTWEIYDNVFTNLDPSPSSHTGTVIEIRGGTGMVFGNKCYYNTVSPNVILNLRYYRACLSNNVTSGITYGQAGDGYIVDFSNPQDYKWTIGYGKSLNGNPTNAQTLILGRTVYTFVSSLASATLNMVNINGNGGGPVLVGGTVAETVTNLLRAVNLVSAYQEISYTRAGSNFPYSIGHDLIAIGCTETQLILTNALDGNTDQYGYPANQQEGILVSYPLTGANFHNAQVVFPVYQWSNTLNGVLGPLTGTPMACDGSQWGGLQSGRDYFDNVSPSPSVYTPLVYPHPLQAFEVAGQSTGTGLPPGNFHAVKGP